MSSKVLKNVMIEKNDIKQITINILWGKPSNYGGKARLADLSCLSDQRYWGIATYERIQKIDYKRMWTWNS